MWDILYQQILEFRGLCYWILSIGKFLLKNSSYGEFRRIRGKYRKVFRSKVLRKGAVIRDCLNQGKAFWLLSSKRKIHF